MEESETRLQVEQNTGQQPFGEGDAQSLQQTRGSESFGVETDQQGVPQADQDEILEFLRSEAAGPSYAPTTAQGGLRGSSFILLPFIAISLILLFVIYYRFFTRRINRSKQ